MGTGAKRAGLAALIVLGLVGAGLAVRACRPPPAIEPAGPDAALPAPATPRPDAAVAAVPASPAEQEATVASVVGKVERQRGAQWASVAVGDKVRAADSLRTGTAGRAELEIDPIGTEPGTSGASRITVTEDTQVSVAELTAAVHRFRIKRGRVAAAYQQDGERVLRIEAESGAAVAEARTARFSVAVTGTSFAVATETGVVDLRSAGSAVTVGAGQASVAHEAEAPRAPAPIPTAVLLKVAAAARGQNPCTLVEGVAEPGSLVTVGDVEAPLDAEGRFRTRFDPHGAKEIRVVLRDVTGRTREERLVCQAPLAPKPEEPIDDLKIRWTE